ncbi:hypothetical protein QVD17_21424 [Tagetes erecta]|uniref:Zinc finger LSD1-type domain-containing protein n=1 Tax=Tagetes erecta TaxID=13708 RepID=A0AAD8KF00_TARER|nr:hypothetical protein QVD17_21424 [Tagetes erecta]
MTEQDDGASPPSPKKLKTDSEEQPLEKLNHSEEKTIQIEDKHDDDAPPPPSSPAPSSTLPPTPPLPSSATDFDVKQQASDGDDGPPPGCDNKDQLKENQAEQLGTLAAASAISSDLQTEDVRQHTHYEEGEPLSQAHPSLPPEVAPSDMQSEDVQQHTHNEEGEPLSQAHPCLPPEVAPSDMQSEDVRQHTHNEEGEPLSQAHPCLPPEVAPSDMQSVDVRQHTHNEEGEPLSQAHPCLPPEVAPSDMQTEDVRQYTHNEEGEPLSQAHPCLPPEVAPSDMQTEDVRQYAHNEEGEPLSQAHPCPPPEVAPPEQVEEQDSADDGPPPGWGSKCQAEPKLQSTPLSDMKMEDVPHDTQNDCQPTPEVPSVLVREDSEDEGPPPGWDSECQPEPQLQQNTQSDIKTNYAQQDESHSCSSPAPELVSSDIKVDEQDSEDDGPPPGWNLKCQPKPSLQLVCPTTPPSDFKSEDDKEDTQGNEGSPPGWGSTPQQQSHGHSSLPSPIVQPGTFYEPNNVKIFEESPQPPSRQLPIYPTIQQLSAPNPPMTMRNPEMAQMVCGSCRHLLSYPRGARYVECACCLEENYVLEEHEVGQVVCGGCNVLLMYPHGAPKVRCANCRTDTEIGDQNRRPSLSEHKRRSRQNLRRVQAG